MAINTAPEKRKSIGEHLEHPYAHYYVLLGSTIGLLSIGLLMVTSASTVYSYQINDGNSWTLALRQAFFAVLGVGIMLRIKTIPLTTIRRWIPIFAYGVIAALVLVLLIGTAKHGQKNWIEFAPGVRIQPSEFAKLAVALYGAHILELKSHLLNVKYHLVNPVGIYFVAVLLLVLAEGDVGTSIVLAPIMVAAFYYIGAPMRIFLALGAIGAVGLAGLSFYAPYRLARFTSWWNPEADPQGTGFQLLHGLQAMGSGGLWGQGLGGSKEKWGTLPEAHTDFIYAVIGEEAGLLGTVIILMLFACIAAVGLRIARHTDDLFISIASFGIVVWIIWQMMVNIGGVIQVMPITGVPLPLVSYGGSSLLPTLAALGLLMSFALHEAKK
jgi:cell division protein FtsW